MPPSHRRVRGLLRNPLFDPSSAHPKSLCAQGILAQRPLGPKGVIASRDHARTQTAPQTPPDDSGMAALFRTTNCRDPRELAGEGRFPVVPDAGDGGGEAFRADGFSRDLMPRWAEVDGSGCGSLVRRCVRRVRLLVDAPVFGSGTAPGRVGVIVRLWGSTAFRPCSRSETSIWQWSTTAGSGLLFVGM